MTKYHARFCACLQCDDTPYNARQPVNVTLYHIDDDGIYHNRRDNYLGLFAKKHAPQGDAIQGDKFGTRITMTSVKRRDAQTDALVQAFMIAAAMGGASSLKPTPRKRRTASVDYRTQTQTQAPQLANAA